MRHAVLLFALGLIWMLQGCATPDATDTNTAAPSPARITVLYDAFGKNPAMTKDWGYSALIEINGKRILFDTGDNPEILAKNVSARNIDLKRLDFVIMSHRHGDHMGGLTYVLNVNPKVPIYAPKEGFGVYGFDLPSKFYREDESLPAEMRYFDGAPPEVMKFGTAFPGANIHLIDKTTEIAPGITLIALVSDAAGTKELKELSLAVDTPEGVVLIVGCSHPGIEAIASEAAKINPHIHLIAGGLHLVVAPDPVIEKVATALHDSFNVDYVAPGHCSGEPTFAALKKIFSDHDLYAGLGTTLSLGANPGAESSASASSGLDDGDLPTYRLLSETSDDAHRPNDGEVRLARAR
jgi:7,8-dihydropterin-6-yl-methyl-4-(beta-D-ribofuranosyl)aminobenzene 5'-phosphate synthase